MTLKPSLSMRLRAELRPALLGRLRMADWIEMPEKEFARQIEELEKDPLFKKLRFGADGMPGVIRRQGWASGRLSSAFYEVNERTTASGERVPVEELLGGKAGLAAKIRAMGQENFERYFVRGEEALPLEEIARRTGLSPEDAAEIHDFLLELGAHEEFFMPDREAGFSKSYTCLARLSLTGQEPEFEFFSAHWARGLYQVRYDLLEKWKEGRLLSGSERRRLTHLLKRLETINLRQSTLFRILETVSKLQAPYLKSRDLRDLSPVSLRKLAHRLDLAPSTVSRALSGRSVQLPWGKELPLIRLIPGRRKVLREIMGEWLESGVNATDAEFAQRLQREYGIKISRRTVNAVRHELTRSR